jgi:hypothetical protein
MEETERYEEHRLWIHQQWAHVILILFAASLMGWGMLLHMTIRETPAKWDFGVLPDTPSESVYSTAEPPTGEAPPLQIAPLPEARPLSAQPTGETPPPAAGGLERSGS